MLRRRFLALGTLLVARPRWSFADVLLRQTAQNWATPTEYFDRLITPNKLFFVRSHFGPPALKERTLKIDGLVDKPLELRSADLARFEEVTVTAALQCAGNGRSLHAPRVPGVQWEHGAMGQAAWTGVRLRDVLQAAGVQPAAKWLRSSGADRPPKPTTPRFVRGLPIARALDPSTLLAHRMNGEPLALEHGAPLRLIVPGWTGNHWVKWITSFHLQAEEVDGFFQQTGYKLDGKSLTTFPVKSLIARPGDGGSVKAGAQEIVGVALSGDAPIARVEVSTDGGAHFADAQLEGEAGAGRWQIFRHRFDATPGTVQAIARATDGAGRTQPEQPLWNQSGYLWNAWHRVRFTVQA
jgi:DMSO/TMAO reductase YedYZ molybdopterin-dependent catalytic subunit